MEDFVDGLSGERPTCVGTIVVLLSLKPRECIYVCGEWAGSVDNNNKWGMTPTTIRDDDGDAGTALRLNSGRVEGDPSSQFDTPRPLSYPRPRD